MTKEQLEKYNEIIAESIEDFKGLIVLEASGVSEERIKQIGSTLKYRSVVEQLIKFGDFKAEAEKLACTSKQ